MNRHATATRLSPARTCRLITLTAVLAAALPALAHGDATAGQISGTVSLDPPLAAAALSFAEVSAWSLGPAQEQPSFHQLRPARARWKLHDREPRTQ